MFLFFFILGLILLVDWEILRPYRDGKWGFLVRWILPPLPDENTKEPNEEAPKVPSQVPSYQPGKYGHRVDTFKTPKHEEPVDGISTLAWEIPPLLKDNPDNQ